MTIAIFRMTGHNQEWTVELSYIGDLLVTKFKFNDSIAAGPELRTRGQESNEVIQQLKVLEQK